MLEVSPVIRVYQDGATEEIGFIVSSDSDPECALLKVDDCDENEEAVLNELVRCYNLVHA